MKDVDLLERVGLSAVLFGLLAVLLMFASYVMLPASRWLEVRSVTVRQAVAGAPILMDVDRTIHRNFEGAWRASIWRSATGGWTPVCSTGWVDHYYRRDSVLPQPLTLDWYVNGLCKTALEPGIYRLDADWKIHPGSLFERQTEFTNVTFEVLSE